MDVEELIVALQKLPKNLPVRFEGMTLPIRKVQVGKMPTWNTKTGEKVKIKCVVLS